MPARAVVLAALVLVVLAPGAGADPLRVDVKVRPGTAERALPGRGAVAVSFDRAGRRVEIVTRRRVFRPRGAIRNYIASPLSDRRALLLHRLAWWRSVTRRGRFPLGVGADGSRRFHPGWTRGFWAGSLWQASDLVPGRDVFARWALDATRQNFGEERADTHDLGFMYERSSVAAHDRLCGGAGRRPGICSRLRRSGLRASGALARLARTNPVAGTIPTRSKTPCRDCTSLRQADTIIDSMMNAPLLVWGGHRDLALRHADGVTRRLVRADGSTAQSVHVDRGDGRVLLTHTHQGLNDSTTWARGQGWAIYGYTATALATGEPRLLDVAERLAGYVRARNPRGNVPRYDYDAPASAPTDASAGVITAAGLLRLERACERMRRCAGRGQGYGDLGERMLDSSLARVRTKPPLGMLRGQVHSLGGSQEWDDSGEFIFGLDYALEAVSLATKR